MLSVYVLVPLLVVLVNCSFAQNTSDTSECLTSEECPADRLCKEKQCVDPCALNVCGSHTVCHVSNHIPMCGCLPGYSGHPFTSCRLDSWDSAYQNASSGWTSHGGKIKRFYINSYVKMNWIQALTHCNSMNMRLATLDSEEEHNRLVALLKQANPKDFGNWWIGCADLGITGNFLWVSTGQPLSYSNFYGENPDNANINGEIEHCVEMRQTDGYNFQWNDATCSYGQYHVCEY